MRTTHVQFLSNSVIILQTIEETTLAEPIQNESSSEFSDVESTSARSVSGSVSNNSIAASTALLLPSNSSPPAPAMTVQEEIQLLKARESHLKVKIEVSQCIFILWCQRNKRISD